MSVTRSDFNPTPPPPGYMVLFDAITPPLNDGDYKLEASTVVQYTGSQESDGAIAPQERYFSIDGPRFTIPGTMVGGVFPPRNGHGSYDENLPHIALARRTLPWERDPNLHDPHPPADNALDPAIPTPWLALLLFEDGECTVTQNVPVRQVVGDTIWQALGSPQDACDQVSAQLDLVQSIMPTVEELKLLTHVRQVNVDYKELSAGSSDGFFSVVMSNRLPEANKSYRACLISVEQRSDLLPPEPPASEVAQIGGIIIGPGSVVGNVGSVIDASVGAAPSLSAGAGHQAVSLASAQTSAAAGHVIAAPPPASAAPGTEHLVESGGVSSTAAQGNAALGGAGVHVTGNVTTAPGFVGPGNILLHPAVNMVLLYSWQFICTGLGTFQDLMQHLDDAMIGTVRQEGHPLVADTGHIPLELRDRAGVIEHVWYRGPLVPEQLSRDPLGPYHAADQARRVLPDVAGEDITYAAAFEVGRLLAMADGRLAQELMRWRRTAFRQIARADTLAHLPSTVRAALPSDVVEELHTLIVPMLATHLISQVTAANIPAADAYRLQAVQQAVGLNPSALSQAWGISAQQASTLLGSAAPGIGGGTISGGATGVSGGLLGATAANTTLQNTLLGLHDGIMSDVLSRQGQG